MTLPQFKPAPPPADRPPDRPGESRKERADKGKPRGRRSKNLETRLGAFLMQTNTILMQIPAVRADALDAAELQLLTKGIADECARHPAIRRYVEAMLDVSASGGLIVTVGIIATRRAARHNLIPPNTLPIPNPALDGMLGQMANMMVKTPTGSAAMAPPTVTEQGTNGDAGPLD